MIIEGSCAIVVGGASGLGEATVRRLHARGADVVIADVNDEKGKALAAELGADFVARRRPRGGPGRGGRRAGGGQGGRPAHLRRLRRHRLAREDRVAPRARIR